MNKLNYIIIFFLIFFLSIQNISAQSINEKSDSLYWKEKSSWINIACVSVPMIATGVIAKVTMPNYKITPSSSNSGFNAFDLIQLTPGVAMLALKASGVESRSSWGRLLVSDALGGALMLGSVELMKYSIDETRPDGSNTHSYPSGHTAIAFMSATMLAREYGWKSPWYTIGGYTIATATGVSRMINNKHWAGDVMTGAGIGILATQLGYYFGDLIFKDKGLTNGYRQRQYGDIKDNPSYLGVNSAITIPLNNLSNGLHLGLGTTASISGSWMLGSHFGVNGEVGAKSVSLSVDDDEYTYINPLNSMHITVGPSLKFPLANRLTAGADIGVGYMYNCSIQDYDAIIKPDKNSFIGKINCNIGYAMFHDFRVRLFVDYSINTFGINVLNGENQFNLPKSETKQALQSLSVGFSSDITF